MDADEERAEQGEHARSAAGVNQVLTVGSAEHPQCERGSALVVADNCGHRQLTREPGEASALPFPAVASVAAVERLLDELAGHDASAVGVAVTQLIHHHILPLQHTHPRCVGRMGLPGDLGRVCGTALRQPRRNQVTQSVRVRWDAW